MGTFAAASIALVSLAGCQSPPLTREERAALDYGPRPEDYEKIVRDYLKARLVAPDFALIEFNAGPQPLYQKALTLKPGKRILAGLYRSMGIAFTRQGNMEEGAHYYRLYLPLCSNFSERTQLQKVLEDYDARRR